MDSQEGDLSMKDMLLPNITRLDRGDSGSTIAIEPTDGVGLQQEQRQPHHKRTPLSVILNHILCLMWVAPMVTLLYLNFSNYIIGPTVWCPSRNCNSHPFDSDSVKWAAKFDKVDHDVNGALLFAAKALEVWFTIVIGLFIYDLVVILATRGGGLPLGYLLAHLEFTDLTFLIRPLTWTSAIPKSTRRNRGPVMKLYLFAGFAGLMTLVVNLMGPATGVLILPTLRWIPTPHIPQEQFKGIQAMHSPAGNTVLAGCDAAALARQNYSCSEPVYGPMMDSIMASTTATWRLNRDVFNYAYQGIPSSGEGLVSFTFNVSRTGNTLWFPIRQTLRQVSDDVKRSFAVASGLSEYAGLRVPHAAQEPNYNHSLSFVLERQGSAIGINPISTLGNVTSKIVSSNREIRCIDGWTNNNFTTSYTKCIRTGSGWSNDANSGYRSAKFSLGDSAANSTAPHISVNVYSADKATYYNNTDDLGSNIRPCLAENASSNCNWESIFSVPLPTELRNVSSDVLVIEFGASTIMDEGPRLWLEAVSYLGFPIYQLDTSDSNSLQLLVRMDNLTDPEPGAIPLVINPSWLLAAWSVNDGDTVNHARSAVQDFLSLATEGENSDSNSSPTDPLIWASLYMLGQALSLISYDSVKLDPSIASPSAAAGPIFHRYATLRVWAFGLSDRTSKLGVSVACTGIALVVLRSLVALYDKLFLKNVSHSYSPIELLVATLQHQSRGEFDGLETENDYAKVRYHMHHHEKVIRFEPEGALTQLKP